MHVFYTSNEKLFKHKIPGTMSHSGFSLSYWSQMDSGANPSQVKRRQAVSAENLEAIRSRFLEMYCFNTPKQEQKDLDAAGTFTRENFICGMFDRALETLERYSPEDFHSLYLPAYVVSALCKNLDQVEEIMCCSGEEKEAEGADKNVKSNPYSGTDLSEWDDADLDDPLFGVLRQKKDGPGDEQEREKELKEERPKLEEPEPEPEKRKKKKNEKAIDCRQNHRQRVGLLRQKYNLTFL